MNKCLRYVMILVCIDILLSGVYAIRSNNKSDMGKYNSGKDIIVFIRHCDRGSIQFGHLEDDIAVIDNFNMEQFLRGDTNKCDIYLVENYYPKLEDGNEVARSFGGGFRQLEAKETVSIQKLSGLSPIRTDVYIKYTKAFHHIPYCIEIYCNGSKIYSKENLTSNDISFEDKVIRGSKDDMTGIKKTVKIHINGDADNETLEIMSLSELENGYIDLASPEYCKFDTPSSRERREHTDENN